MVDNKRVAVLGTAGSGKSTELIALANHFANAESPFVPVYRKLNSYVDESLDVYLPPGWSEIPPEICLKNVNPDFLSFQKISPNQLIKKPQENVKYLHP